jgi:uncharacterized protein
MSHEFSISVADIDAAGKAFDFPVPAKWMRGALEDCEATTTGKDGHLAVRVSRSGHDLVVRGRLTAELEVPCGRCLAPTKFSVDQDLSLLFVPAKELRKTQEDAELDIRGEDADTFPYEGETLVLDDIVRDELVLETPMIPLCSEDCPGIRPAEEAGKAEAPPEPKVDPRLAPLLRFRAGAREPKS